ncbi:MAG: hypothetical protein ACK50A_01890 [Sphingobacteriaceae bacterium]|jgi:hypothetical protein
MVSSGDREYIETKAIKKGQKQIQRPFSELAEWIKTNYGVRPLNIIYDVLGPSYQPRLQIIFEHYTDNINFKASNGLFPNATRQESVQNAFREIIKNNSDYIADNLYVIFSSFESIAKEESNSKIKQEQLDALRDELKPYGIWEIRRNFYTGIFFFNSDEQLRLNDNLETKNRFQREYFKLIKSCDEFGYLEESSFSIMLDSKENFEKNYQGNWFYYFKDH